MRHFYQYNEDGWIYARISSLTDPGLQRQFEYSAPISITNRKYDEDTKQITTYKAIFDNGEYVGLEVDPDVPTIEVN